VNWVRLPPGRTSCPFHWHLREDEVFVILEGKGLLRYGDDVLEVGPGDCVNCPRNAGVGHQIANVSDRDLVYLAIGGNDPDEVAVYPDTGKILVRGLRRIVKPQDAKYMDGEPIPPRILRMKPGKAERATARAKRKSSR
jgi:uncharacterized cupin superfamily protein